MTSDKDAKSDEVHSDAILRIIASSREDLQCFAICTEPGRQGHVQLPVLDGLNAPDLSGLGSLHHLPIEILLLIIVGLDLQSALSFGQAGQATRWLLASVPEYRRLRENATGCLWVLHRTRLAKYVDISSLHSTLTTKECFFCGDFGGFLHMFIGARCCYRCLSLHPGLRVLPLRYLRMGLGGSRPLRLSECYRILQSIPGACGYDDLREKHIQELVAPWAEKFVHRPAGGYRDLDHLQHRVPQDELWRRRASACLPYLDLRTGEVQTGVSCKGCRISVQEDGRLENKRLRQMKLYSREGLLQHFHGCEYAKELWASAN